MEVFDNWGFYQLYVICAWQNKLLTLTTAQILNEHKYARTLKLGKYFSLLCTVCFLFENWITCHRVVEDGEIISGKKSKLLLILHSYWKLWMILILGSQTVYFSKTSRWGTSIVVYILLLVQEEQVRALL